MNRPLRTIICLVALASADRLQTGRGAEISLNRFFPIQVVDEETGRGVPLVALRTVNKAVWWTDSQGWVAFHEPGLMDREVYFHVDSPGYEFPKDFFGNRGVKLKPVAGGRAQIKVKRLNIAERLYRLTGQGIYRDSVLLGEPVPLQHPLLNGQVMGQDTVIATPYRGKLYWFWGDTDRPGYPLGNFGASGATSELTGHGGLDPSVGVDLTYFTDTNGFSKPMCPLPGSGLRWIEAVFTVPDETGADRLVARVANVRDLSYVNDWHLMLFNDQQQIFESIRRWEVHEGHDSSHPFRATVHGANYFYLYPNFRVRAELDALRDLANYEAFTCVAHDGKLRGAQTEIDRDTAGRARYSWKAGADRLKAGRVRELISMDKLKSFESPFQLLDVETGSSLPPGRGSVFWNAFRQRWVRMVSGKAGEIWFTEADTPVGPWAYARRVVTHGEYNFYNPTQHPFFDQEGGRAIYFEGTYTASFSGARSKTPRYDYNQIMYRLRLDDPRLSLPAPVYRVRAPDGHRRWLMREGIEAERTWEQIEEVAFFALPPARSRQGFIPIFADAAESGGRWQTNPPTAGSEPLFLALPIQDSGPARTLDGLWEYRSKTEGGGELTFSLEMKWREDHVALRSENQAMTGSGTYRERALELNLTNGPTAYTLIGRMRDRELAGTWRRTDDREAGTWSAKRTAHPGIEDSPDIVPLYPHRDINGRLVYSTTADPADDTSPGTAAPLCRVWRNPAPTLMIDFDAQPVVPPQ